MGTTSAPIDNRRAPARRCSWSSVSNEAGRDVYPDSVSTTFSRYARECGLATVSARLKHASTAVTSKISTHMLTGADRTAVDAHAAVLFTDLDEAMRLR